MSLRFHRNRYFRTLAVLCLSYGSFVCLDGQNLIGHKYDDIRKFMRTNHTDMIFDGVSNSKFNYLRYVDAGDSQTLLFFMGQDSVCSSIRLVCDATVRASKVKEFNTKYSKSGENRWTDHHDGKNYIITLKEEKWSSVITIEPEK